MTDQKPATAQAFQPAAQRRREFAALCAGLRHSCMSSRTKFDIHAIMRQELEILLDATEQNARLIALLQQVAKQVGTHCCLEMQKLREDIVEELKP